MRDIKSSFSHITPFISDSTSTVPVSSHTDYRSYNPHCMYDTTATMSMTSYELHMTKHPLSMISHHSMTSHSLFSCHQCSISDIASPVHGSLLSILIIPHQDYLWYQAHCMYDILWLFCDLTPTLYDITSLYSWQHMQSFHDTTPTVYDITYTLLVTSRPL